jgi:hypothetical protein
MRSDLEATTIVEQGDDAEPRETPSQTLERLRPDEE